MADLPPPSLPPLEEIKTPKPGTVPLQKPKKPPVAEAPVAPPPPVVVERKVPSQRFFPTDVPPEGVLNDPGRRR